MPRDAARRDIRPVGLWTTLRVPHKPTGTSTKTGRSVDALPKPDSLTRQLRGGGSVAIAGAENFPGLPADGPMAAGAGYFQLSFGGDIHSPLSVTTLGAGHPSGPIVSLTVAGSGASAEVVHACSWNNAAHIDIARRNLQAVLDRKGLQFSTVLPHIFDIVHRAAHLPAMILQKTETKVESSLGKWRAPGVHR